MERINEKGITVIGASSRSWRAVKRQRNFSPDYLGSRLRIYTQQSIQQHIQNKLIDYTKEQLSSTNLSISKIA